MSNTVSHNDKRFGAMFISTPMKAPEIQIELWGFYQLGGWLHPYTLTISDLFLGSQEYKLEICLEIAYLICCMSFEILGMI